MRTSVICALLVLSVVGVLGGDQHDQDEHDHRKDHDHRESGDLGDSNGAEEKDVKEAKVETQGMFDSDIRATRAFASLDDAMDGLKNELASSKTTKDDKLKATMLLQEDAGGRNLGESSESQEEATLDASTEGMYDADVRATRAFTALDNEMDKLKTELSIKGSSKPLSASSNTDQSVTKSKDIGESEDQARDDDKDDDEDRDHDERDHDEDDDDRDEDRNRDEGQEALIQVGSTKGFGETLANKLVMDDLKTSDSSLMARAKMEASQWSSMNKIEASEEEETRHDLAEAQNGVNTFTTDDNALEVTELDEADADSKAHNVKETGGLAAQLQQAETKQAKEYMAQAANKESAIIARAEAKEKKMEDDARNVLVKDVKRIKQDEQDATWHLKKVPA